MFILVPTTCMIYLVILGAFYRVLVRGFNTMSLMHQQHKRKEKGKYQNFEKLNFKNSPKIVYKFNLIKIWS